MRQFVDIVHEVGAMQYHNRSQLFLLLCREHCVIFCNFHFFIMLCCQNVHLYSMFSTVAVVVVGTEDKGEKEQRDDHSKSDDCC